jgi:hypothetical protein
VVLIVELCRGSETIAAEVACMNTMRKCNSGPRHVSFVAAILALLFLGSPLFAQNSSMAERLPPNTILYVEWRGSGFVTDAEKTNHLLQLMEDPAVAPAWLALATAMQKNMAKQGTNGNALNAARFISLVSNSVVLGVSENPDYAKASDKKPSPVGFFIVYDAKGKKESIEQMRALHRSSLKAGNKITHYQFGETTVEEEISGEDHNYTALDGGYYIYANLKPQIEELITRFRSDAKPSKSLADSPEYKESRKYVAPDSVFEVFARMPNYKQWIPDDPKSAPIIKAVDNIHLDRIHSFAMGMSFKGGATRLSGATLGDTSAGSLFDFTGESSADFALQPALADSQDFSVSRLNWAALYQVIRGAVEGNLPPQQAAGLGAVEGMAQGYLGMSITDALTLFSGETASTLAIGDDGTTQQMFIVTVKKQDEVLRMLRAVLGTMIATEDTSGSTTFLDLTYPYKDPATGTQRREFYYVAVGPKAVVIGKRKAKVRAMMDALNASGDKPAATGIFADKEYLEMRSVLPEKLSALGFTDFRALPVDKLVANFMTQMQSGAGDAKDAPDMSWLKGINGDLIARHIRMSVRGSWKDAHGIYFDWYLQ